MGETCARQEGGARSGAVGLVDRRQDDARVEEDGAARPSTLRFGPTTEHVRRAARPSIPRVGSARRWVSARGSSRDPADLEGDPARRRWDVARGSPEHPPSLCISLRAGRRRRAWNGHRRRGGCGAERVGVVRRVQDAEPEGPRGLPGGDVHYCNPLVPHLTIRLAALAARPLLHTEPGARYRRIRGGNTGWSGEYSARRVARGTLYIPVGRTNIRRLLRRVRYRLVGCLFAGRTDIRAEVGRVFVDNEGGGGAIHSRSGAPEDGRAGCQPDADSPLGGKCSGAWTRGSERAF